MLLAQDSLYRGGLGLLLTLCSLALLMTLVRALAERRAHAPPDPVKVVVEREEARIARTAGMVPSPGSFGEIELNDVDEPTAALLMAIVADDIGIPLNELRFVYVREAAGEEPAV
jgi:hypothetical protein